MLLAATVGAKDGCSMDEDVGASANVLLGIATIAVDCSEISVVTSFGDVLVGTGTTSIEETKSGVEAELGPGRDVVRSSISVVVTGGALPLETGSELETSGSVETAGFSVRVDVVSGSSMPVVAGNGSRDVEKGCGVSGITAELDTSGCASDVTTVGAELA